VSKDKLEELALKATNEDVLWYQKDLANRYNTEKPKDNERMKPEWVSRAEARYAFAKDMMKHRGLI